MGRWFLFILMVLSLPATAQEWEFIGGPGDEQMRGLTIAPNGAIYVISNGIYRSSDKGVTWRRTGLELPIGSSSPKIRCGKDGTLFLSTEKSLWKSVDEGLTWYMIRSGSNSSYHSVAVTPQGTILTLDRDSVAISNDGGGSWREIYVTEDVENLFVDSIGTIFVTGRFDSYRSTDEGQNWSKLINGFPTNRDVYDMQFTGDGKTLVSTRDGVYISSDRGLTWPHSGEDVTIYEMSIAGKDLVYGMGSSGEVYRSTNLGIIWSELSDDAPSFYRNDNIAFFDGTVFYYFNDRVLSRDVSDNRLDTIVIPTALVKDLIVTPAGSVFAVTKKSNIWAFTSSPWTQLNGFAGTHAMAVDSANILYGIGGTKFFKSTNGGTTVIVSNGIGSSVTGLAVGQQGEVLAVTPEEGFYRSTDGGKIWMQSNAGIPDKNLSSVAIGSGDVFFAGGNTRYYRSTDEGLTWTEPIFPFITGSGTVRAICTRGESVVFGIDLTGVYFSTDNGVTWENHSTGLALDTIFDITITSRGDVLCATSSGIYLYAPALQTWTEMGPSAVRTSVRTIAEGKDGRLYVGTEGFGVYRTKNAFSDVATKPPSSSDISLYPNPASTRITVDLGASEPRDFTISIYDVLGVCRMVSTGEQTLNISSLPNGQYVVRIKVGGTLETHLMTVTH